MQIRNHFWFLAAKVYSRLYGFFKDSFNINIRGLGYILRKVKSDHEIIVNGRHFYFAHQMSEAYARPLHGKWNEPETHELILDVIDKLNVIFIEVGANIGEILVDIAAHPLCAKAIAFEPNPEAVSVINKNITLNTLGNCIIINKALGHVSAIQRMWFGMHSPTASLLSTESTAGVGVDVEVSTLDSEINTAALGVRNIIILIDVEGYELNVIRGGIGLINEFGPLIIFEYHQKTKKVFDLVELQDVLGDSYQIYRVRQDAMLDCDVENAWNCVAIPRNSQFEKILEYRIVS